MCKKNWNISCSTILFEKLRTDERFIAILNLARISNALLFCQISALDSRKDNNPSSGRQVINSFLYASAVLYEGLNRADSLGQYFKDLESFKITFKVTYEWLEENNVDKESVILMRYHNGKWHELKTTILNEDAVYVYYEAETPGTSTFAIAGEQMIVETQTEISFMNYIVIAAAVAAIVVIGVSVVYFRRRQ